MYPQAQASVRTYVDVSMCMRTRTRGSGRVVICGIKCVCVCVTVVCHVSAEKAPDGYDAMYKRYAAQGARVISLAYRDLGTEQVRRLSICMRALL